MGLKEAFREMAVRLSERYPIPPIASAFFPPFSPTGQPGDAQFMAFCLEGGAVGISYVLVPDDQGEAYNALRPRDFIDKHPLEYARLFKTGGPVNEGIALAAINAICQHVMRIADFDLDYTTDSLGLLDVKPGDTVGMVGLFSRVVASIQKAGAQLIVVEKNEQLIEKHPGLSVTRDVMALKACNKVLCTSTTLLNDSMEEILSHCPSDAFVSVIGPSAGYFPDPLFALGVDVVGGRAVDDGPRFMRLLAQGRRWGPVARRTCFQKKTYRTILD